MPSADGIRHHKKRKVDTKPEARDVGLPIRPILWTLDQIATITSIPQRSIEDRYVHFDGRSVGPRQMKKMLARNLALAGEHPDWRVAEAELVRWLKASGFRIYERGWVRV